MPSSIDQNNERATQDNVWTDLGALFLILVGGFAFLYGAGVLWGRGAVFLLLGALAVGFGVMLGIRPAQKER